MKTIPLLLSVTASLASVSCLQQIQQDSQPEIINGVTVPAAATDLQRAIIQKNTQEVIELLNDGADPNKTNSTEIFTSPLYYAIEVSDGDTTVISALLKAGARIDDEVFQAAVREGYPQYIQVLLDAGAKIPPPSSYSGNIFNQIQVYSKEPLACAELLLKAGAKVTDQKNPENGKNALHYITDGGHPDMVAFFVKHGLDVNAQDCEGKTPLMDEFCQFPEIIRALLKAGANPNIRNNKGENAVMYYIANERTTGGWEELPDGSILHWDGSEINKGALKEIIDGGGNVNMKDKEGYLPLDRCPSYETEVEEMLKKAGAKHSK